MNSLKFLLVRIFILLSGGALAVVGSYVFSLGFSMQNSSAADVCFGFGLLIAFFGLFAISASINLKKRSDEKCQ